MWFRARHWSSCVRCSLDRKQFEQREMVPVKAAEALIDCLVIGSEECKHVVAAGAAFASDSLASTVSRERAPAAPLAPRPLRQRGELVSLGATTPVQTV
jgi:hypothetical protein